jgi:filamentous hemagglutinin family protein
MISSSPPRRAPSTFRLHPVAAAASALLLGASGPLWGQALPVAPQVVSGSASVRTSGAQMTVANTPNAIINWQSFSIGAQNAVRFQQQNSASQVLNRVVGNDLSSILGALNSNGRVWLVNPNGVVFGPGARIDVGGLVASTLAISNEDFLSGRYAFQSTGSRAAVTNRGEITTTPGGRVWLVGETVGNEGVVRAEGGSIVLAAGKSVELVDSAVPNVRVKLTAPDNEVLNLGSLLAPNGSIDLHSGMVNQQGIVRADSLDLDAAGRITIRAKNGVQLGAASETSASGRSGSGGTVTIDAAEGRTLVGGALRATSGEAVGGSLAVLGAQVVLANGAQLDASGALGGGQVLVGGDYQGRNPEVHNATHTAMEAGAGIAANATRRGDGGRVIVWGNDSTQVYGTLAAHGAGDGNGGLLETSGGQLTVRPASIDLAGGPQGHPGTWLLDPNNIRIVDFDPDGGNTSQTDSNCVPAATGCQPPGPTTTISTTNDSSQVFNGLIQQQLNNGVNVKIVTGTEGANTQPGDINVAADINATAPRPGSLVLSAHRNIILNGTSITSSGGPMGITLGADSDGDGNGVVALINAKLVSAGGDVALSGGGKASAPFSGVLLSGALIDAGAGTVALTGHDFGDPVFDPVANNIFFFPGVSLTNSSILAGAITAGGGSIAIDGRGTDLNGLPAPSMRTSRSMTLTADGPLQLLGGAALDGGAGSISLSGRDVTPVGAPFLPGVFISNSQVRSGSVSVGGDSLRLQAGSVIATGGDVAVTVDHAILTDLDPATPPSLIRSEAGDVTLTASGAAGVIQVVNLTVDAARNLTVTSAGGVSASASVFSAAGALSVDTNDSDLIMDAARFEAGSVRVIAGAGTLTARPGAQLVGTGPGTAVALSAATVDNQAGTGLISTPAGRWLVYLPQPPHGTGLPIQFEAFGVTAFNEPPAPANQSGVAYSAPLAFSLLLPGRTYDATTSLALADPLAVSGGLPGYSVRTDPQLVDTGAFLDKNVGADKPVLYAGPKYSVQGAAGVPVFGADLSFRSSITPAVLTYVADPALRFAGAPVTGLDGRVAGLLGADTLAADTTGTLSWTTPATSASAPGFYPITGSGLAARNYTFTQAASNASALTLSPAASADSLPRTFADAGTHTLDVAFRTALATISAPTGGSLLDSSSGDSLFGPVNVGSLSEEELARLLENRRRFKQKLFADAIYKLEIDPALADVPACASAAEGASGLCRYTPEQVAEAQAASGPAPAPDVSVKKGAVPQIHRKVAVFFGVSEYQDKKIPSLQTSLPDVDSVAKVVSERMGYEVRIVRNPTKADIVATLNKLAAELATDDSLLIYYSGHGYTLQRNGLGYWLAADAPTDDPKQWISNEDVSRMLAAVRSKQVALVTDSCYSAAFTREGAGELGLNASAEDLLTKRSVVVLASGGDEPVSDEAKDGHSIFAWNLMNTLGAVENWRPGTNVFTQVQASVRKELPQTPRYGTMRSAGHQPGGDYLFEQR